VRGVWFVAIRSFIEVNILLNLDILEITAKGVATFFKELKEGVIDKDSYSGNFCPSY
jgi:hypothetical protein